MGFWCGLIQTLVERELSVESFAWLFGNINIGEPQREWIRVPEGAVLSLSMPSVEPKDPASIRTVGILTVCRQL